MIRPSAVLAGLIGALVVLPGLAHAQTIVDIGRAGPREVAIAILILLLVFSVMARRSQWQVSRVLGGILIWTGVAIALISGYAFRDQVGTIGREVVAAVVPGSPIPQPGGGVVVGRSIDGQFMVRGAVDGAPIVFVFDTGASTVVLSHEAAMKAGIDAGSLAYTRPVYTASGVTEVAPIRIASLTVGTITRQDVPAAVAKPGSLAISLLGNTFLDRLSGYQVTRDRLTLLP